MQVKRTLPYWLTLIFPTGAQTQGIRNFKVLECSKRKKKKEHIHICCYHKLHATKSSGTEAVLPKPITCKILGGRLKDDNSVIFLPLTNCKLN